MKRDGLERGIFAEATRLGFDPGPDAMSVACNGGPTLFRFIPGLWPAYPRLLAVGANRVALFEANRIRSAPKRLIWCGARDGISAAPMLGGFLTRVVLPGPNSTVVFVDAKSEARRLRAALGY
ncbi:MAG: hypothetical protein GEV08_01305 [Acidimicrobiia bacterium]|nr:hypothetical protein [Acidimicrobiia bacterium]